MSEPDIKHTRLPISKCFNCHSEMDGATSVEGATPTPGSIAICLACSHVMAYGEGLLLRELNDGEIKELAGHPDMLRLLAVVARFRKEKARGKTQKS